METPDFIMYAITALDHGVYLGERDGKVMWSEDEELQHKPEAAMCFEEDHANKIVDLLIVAGYKTVEKKEIIPDLQEEFASSRHCANILFMNDWME